jgi:hypothetical protein
MVSIIREAAMKEDILEQLVDDYLMLKGYFTRLVRNQAHAAIDKGRKVEEPEVHPRHLACGHNIAPSPSPMLRPARV